MAGGGAGPEERALRSEKEEARRRREQREEARRAARLARAESRRRRLERLEARRTREVLHAGRGVSTQLAYLETDVAALEARGLPVLRDAAELAQLLGLDLRTLRWLTYHRDVASTCHYRQFQIPKARGGLRTISAPRRRLRDAQQVLRRELLSRLAPTEQAQAFVPGRSTLTNARAHLRRDVVVKLDVSDFFGAITYPRVRGAFRALGYSGMVSSLLALLVTEAPRVRAEIDGEAYFVATGARSLPQGAPTSPALTNWVARRLDRRLLGYARPRGWTYTRYADDLAFSRDGDDRAAIGALLGLVKRVLESEGFRLHPDKVFVARKGRQQRVTGIVVNEVPGIPRAELRRFRAAVHRVSRDGFADLEERRRLVGYASYVQMVKPAQGRAWLEVLRAAPIRSEGGPA